jgi:stage V sporulation protein S
MQEIIREDGLPSGVADGYVDGYPDGTNPQGQQAIDASVLVAEPPVGVQVLKVSARSQPSMLAGAIAGVLRSGDVAQLQAIGAGAVNQAVKAIATARTYLEADDIDLMCIPAFTQVELEGEQRTAISIRVEQF